LPARHAEAHGAGTGVRPLQVHPVRARDRSVHCADGHARRRTGLKFSARRPIPRDQNLDRQGVPVKNALSRRLLAAFALIIALVAVAGGVAGWFTWKTQDDFHSLYHSTVRSGELGKADSALWQLRYSLPMAASADEA